MDVSKGSASGPFAKLAALRDALPVAETPQQPAKGTIAGILAKRAATQAPKASAGGGKMSKLSRAERDADDAKTFLDEMAGVAPLGAPKRSRVAPVAPERAPKRVSDDAEVLAELADLCDGAGTFEWADTDEHIEGIADGVDRRLLKRLRAGDFAIQAHVDLHGLTRAEAKDKVSRFVDDARRAGHRTVLVVHGRGLHSKDHVPVLKQALTAWLERGHLARAVLAFATARPADGGTGAVVLLLRKRDG